MTISNTIMIGVFSGLLASIAFLLLSKFINLILIPWYQNIIYNGTNVEGTWKTTKTFSNGSKQETILFIKQNATLISASVTVVKTNQGEVTIIKNFKFKGILKERFLCISGQNIDNKQIGFVSSLLEVKSGGKELEGVESWYDVASNSIQSINATYMRDNT